MGHQWEQRADYLQACNWQAPPGVPMTYNPPRPVGRESATDVTDFHYGQSFWNEDNLPEVMYMLNPDDDWRAFKTSGRPNVPPMVDPSSGYPCVEQWPRPGTQPRTLLDFPILRGINKIGTDENWWWFEIIRRLDPRISYPDLTMRMEFTGLRRLYNDKQFVDRVFNNRASRTMRPAWGMLNWQSKLQGGSKTEAQTLAKLSGTQVQNNTTRGMTPGLTDPSRPEGRNNLRVPVPIFRGIKGRNVGTRGPNTGQENQQPLAANIGSPATVATYMPAVAIPRLPNPITGPRRRRRSRPSPSIPRPKRRRREQTVPADDEDTLDSALETPALGPAAPRAQNPYGSAPRMAPPSDEGTILSNRPAYRVPANPYAFADEDPAYVATLSVGSSNTGHGAMRSQPSYDAPRVPSPLIPFAQPYIPFPGAPSVQIQLPSSGRPGYYRQTHFSTRPSSASNCLDCGLRDPLVLHILHGCPVVEPAMGQPLRGAAEAIGNDEDVDPDLDAMESQEHTLEELNDEALEEPDDTFLGYRPPPGTEPELAQQNVTFSRPPTLDSSGRRRWSDDESN